MGIFIPESVRNIIGDKPYVLDTVGCSGATVLIFDDYVLKIADLDEDWHRNLKMSKWIRGRLPVPETLAVEELDGKGYLLMSRIKGSMCSSVSLLYEPKKMCELLVAVIHKFWELPIAECPVTYSLDEKLDDCEWNIAHGYYKEDETWPRQYDDKWFDAPETLLLWLRENKPVKPDLVVCHGDLYLSNIFAQSGVVTGLIDFTWSGVADRYQDIALCVRSFRSVLAMIYTDSAINDILSYFVSMLGIELDIDKLWYHIMLDELV